MMLSFQVMKIWMAGLDKELRGVICASMAATYCPEK
jgi:hypothetical protein